jgi:hypothetical protein
VSSVSVKLWSGIGRAFELGVVNALITVVSVIFQTSFSELGTAVCSQTLRIILPVPAGVGRKVADCVALFSLDKHDVIPVDTHVWTIACRDFDTSLASAKSLTPAVYERVGDLFRSRYGPYAGWAHRWEDSTSVRVYHHEMTVIRLLNMLGAVCFSLLKSRRFE